MIKIIEANYIDTLLEQPLREMKSYKARSTRNKSFHETVDLIVRWYFSSLTEFGIV